MNFANIWSLVLLIIIDIVNQYITEQRCSYREIIENLYRSRAIRLEYSIELESIEQLNAVYHMVLESLFYR
jgi:hypothetical protein